MNRVEVMGKIAFTLTQTQQLHDHQDSHNKWLRGLYQFLWMLHCHIPWRRALWVGNLDWKLRVVPERWQNAKWM